MNEAWGSVVWWLLGVVLVVVSILAVVEFSAASIPSPFYD